MKSMSVSDESVSGDRYSAWCIAASACSHIRQRTEQRKKLNYRLRLIRLIRQVVEALLTWSHLWFHALAIPAAQLERQ